MKASNLNAILYKQREKCSVVLITYIETGNELLCDPHSDSDLDALELNIAEGVKDAARSDTSKLIKTDKGDVFLHVFNTPLRLIIIGAVHIAQPLTQMANVAGYDITVVDPRHNFADIRKFPKVNIITKWPDETIDKLEPDSRTAVVTLTHDPKLDDPALRASLRYPVFYIGALGSKKTHKARIKRLIESGLDEKECERINGPTGLPIGAKSTAEIAIAILAEMTQALRKQESYEI